MFVWHCLLPPCCVHRSPDSAKTKAKMLYSSTQKGFKEKLGQFGGMIQANDASDLSYDEVLDEAK